MVVSADTERPGIYLQAKRGTIGYHEVDLKRQGRALVIPTNSFASPGQFRGAVLLDGGEDHSSVLIVLGTLWDADLLEHSFWFELVPLTSVLPEETVSTIIQRTQPLPESLARKSLPLDNKLKLHVSISPRKIQGLDMFYIDVRLS